MSYEIEYFKDVLGVLQKLQKLSLYAIEPNKVEYRIKVENGRSLAPMDEWKIVEQLVTRGVVTKYEESDTFEAQVSKTALTPEFIFYLEIIPEKFDTYLTDIKSKIKLVESNGTVSITWPAEYKWLSEKVFQSKQEIVFNSSKSDRAKVFAGLVKAKGSWVKSKDLIGLLRVKKEDKLRLIISQLNKKILGSGLKITPRRDRSFASAYRIAPSL